MPDIHKLQLQLRVEKVGEQQMHILVSAVLGSFPVCYILSRTTTKLFMKPSIYDSMVGTVH